MPLFLPVSDVAASSATSRIEFMASESKKLAKSPIVYPNPFKNAIFIDNLNNQYTEAVMTDVLGKVIFKVQLINKITKIDDRMPEFSNIPDGIYFVTLSGGEARYTMRIVKSEK
ncbi:MAG: T9SS type A sorting domain-containing protein [Bacteroidetes bacterium]|nr:T9SS type A sorting domain-containing protein [Bacteroidota bacterium]